MKGNFNIVKVNRNPFGDIPFKPLTSDLSKENLVVPKALNLRTFLGD